MPSPPTLPAGLVSVSPFSHLCLIFLHTVSRASLFILIFSPLLYTQPHTLLHVTRHSSPRVHAFFSVSFTCRIVERNFVPRKRFKRYERALKTCFVRGKRFRRDEERLQRHLVPLKTFIRYQMDILKESQKINYVAGKARRGWSLWRHGRP